MKTHLFEYIKKKRGNRTQLTNKISPLNPTSIIKLLIINLYTLIIIFSLSSCGADLDEDNGVIAMAAGQYHTVAIKKDGTVWAWGYNNRGQLGDSTTDNRTSPVQVVGKNGVGFLEDIIAVSVGTSHTVAIESDGKLWAWGQNNRGQLGNGSYDTTGISHPIPAQVVDPNPLSPWVAVSAGSYHTLAVKKNGTLWTWGLNDIGQLGDGSKTQKDSPVQVVGKNGVGFLEDVIAVAAGLNHTVAIKKDGTLWAWGSNQNGQLGDGSTTQKDSPVQVVYKNGFELEDVIAVAAGANHTVALKKDGTLWAWGQYTYGKLGIGDPQGGEVVDAKATNPVQVVGRYKDWDKDWFAVFAGGDHTVALKKDGTLWAWGLNDIGQLGLGDKGNNRNIPTRLGEAADLVGVSGGSRYSMALRRSGILWTWGDNTYGQLGLGTTEERLRPTAVKWP